MTTIVKIDGHAIDLAEFVRILKLTGQFEALLEQFVRDRLSALGARKQPMVDGFDLIEEEHTEDGRSLQKADVGALPAADSRRNYPVCPSCSSRSATRSSAMV